jgi:xanthine dehydrogenase YagR molybdenum-binding subunit
MLSTTMTPPIAIGSVTGTENTLSRITAPSAKLTHGVLVTSGIAKGRIVSIDSAAVERLPGVISVLTHKSGLKLAKDPSKVDPGSPRGDRVLQVLEDDRVRYGNQPVAIVVAETFEIARDAALRVKVHYASASRAS